MEELREMTVDQLQERLEELRGIGENPEERSADELEQLAEERTAIDNELTERRAAAAREQLRRDNVANGQTGGKIMSTMPETNENRNYTIDSPEYRSGLLKQMMGQDLTAEERDAVSFVATTTDATYGSGNVLPRTMVNEIWDLIDDQHAILADITLYRTGTILEVPVRSSIEQGDAKSVNENAANDDEINSFTKITLAGKDFSKTVSISYAMAKMSIDAFEAYLVNEIAERLGAALAADVVAQIASDYDDTNNAIVGTTEDEIGFADVASAFGVLKNAKGGVVVYGRRSTIYKYLVGMVDTAGRPIFQLNANEGAEGTLIGAPVKVEDAVDADTLLIGYPKQVVGNMIQDVMVETDRDIKKHNFIYSGYARFQCKLVADAAFATLVPGTGE